MRDRVKMAELLGKTEGMFVDTQVVSEAESHYRQSNEGWNIRKELLMKNNPEVGLKLGAFTQKEYDEWKAKQDGGKTGTTDS